MINNFKGEKKMSESSFDVNSYDHYVYIGAINRSGYHRLCNEIQKHKKKDRAILCIATHGGDPNAGFRIGRALQHYYNGNVTAYIIDICKSAGTLTVIAAKTIIMADKSELGPLDIQLRKDDEIGVSNSGLDIFKTLETLEERASLSFSKYLQRVRFGHGLSTRMSADIASKLVDGIIKPIAEQIDPMKIGEHQRATDIAIEYGQRLNQTSHSLLSEHSLNKLIRGYPSHGFVIDRKEARELFSCIEQDNPAIIDYYSSVRDVLDSQPDIVGSKQFVEYYKPEVEIRDENDESATTDSNSNESIKTDGETKSDSRRTSKSKSDGNNPAAISKTDS